MRIENVYWVFVGIWVPKFESNTSPHSTYQLFIILNSCTVLFSFITQTIFCKVIIFYNIDMICSYYKANTPKNGVGVEFQTPAIYNFIVWHFDDKLLSISFR